MTKPVLHGRDHRPEGADPIPDLGGGSGIQFDVDPQSGGYLVVTGSTAGPVIGGGNTPSVLIETTQSTSFADGALMLRAPDGTLRTESQDLYMQLGDPVSGVISYADFAQELQLQADSAVVIVSALIRLIGLPTSDPGVSGALWDSSGTVKISP